VIVRVILADGHENVRTALRLLIEEEAGWFVAAEATNANRLLALVEQNQPDLILLDAGLPGKKMEELLYELRRTYPRLMLIVLSGRPETHQPALRSGANAFVSKGNPPEDLLWTIHALVDSA
jgi:DNA-binding NarL/FixJ family response regulator